VVEKTQEDITKERVLLVEGKEEKRFLEVVFQKKNINNIQVIPIEGKTKISSKLAWLAADKWKKTIAKGLGIILDADKNPSGTENSIKYHLEKNGFTVPEEALKGKKVENITVVYTVLPSTTEEGMLETLCLKSVDDELVMDCVKDLFVCVKEKVSEKDYPENEWKAKVHAYLATKRFPDKRLGEAAEAGYWPLESEAFKDIMKLLEVLSGCN